MNEVFMPAATLVVKRPLTNSMDPAQYDSDIAELQGVTAELYESLPDNFHHELENSIEFRNLVSILQQGFPLLITSPVALQFLRQLNSNRRSIIHQFRSSTASEIFGHLTQYYRIQYNREVLPEFRALMKFPADEDAYPKYPPLLFPDKQYKNLKKLFWSVELTKVRFKYTGSISILISCLDA
jgi:hypothetical protein